MLTGVSRLRLNGLSLLADVVGKFNDSMQRQLLDTALIQTPDANIARIALSKGANVNACDNENCSALIKAAELGLFEKANILLDYGAGVDAADSEGRTALMKAAARGHKDMVALLLERGADFHIKDRWGMTALMWAEAEKCASCADLIKLAGANE